MATTESLGPKFYPYGAHLLQSAVRPICSEQGGITQSLLVGPLMHSPALDIRSITAQMPPYHKVLLNPDAEVQYHLGGYGAFHEEALVRFVGEAVERYSLLVAQSTFAEKIRYATYDQIARSGRVVPFDYLRLFGEADYVKLSRGRKTAVRPLERNDVVGWLPCASLFDPGTDIWVPAQVLFVGYKHNRAAGEVSFSPAFSTGTAAHRSVEKALQNALFELIEIDALMVRWYTATPAPLVAIDNLNLAMLAPKMLGDTSEYEVLALDFTLLDGVDAHVFATVIVNKRRERPYILLGAQAHLNPVKAFYRALMEAVAISFLGIYGPLYMPREYLGADARFLTDLDSNVAFFASPENAEEKRAAIDALIFGKRALSTMKNHDTGDVAADTARLVRQLSATSEYGVYLDVTPPETSRFGWKVMRAFIPELVTLCVPGVPYSNHPRIKAHGGVRHDYPHPLP